MLKRMVLAALLILAPSVGWAQTQENYLPAKSQLYFRWDGMYTHQATYDKTAVGKMMKGETGIFLNEFVKWASEQMQNAARNEPKVGPFLKDLTKLLGSMYQHGLVLGIEIDQVLPPRAQAVLVFPKGAGESGVLMPLIHKIGEETKANVVNTKIGKRFVHSVDVEFLKVGWWAQGEDAVLYIGTDGPVEFAKAIDAKTAGIAGNPHYKKIVGFKEFPTCARGYIDFGGLLGVASAVQPEAGKVIDELGFKGLRSLTFVSGFDGLAERSIVDLDMPSPRKGLLSLGSQKKLTLADLPKLPNDLTGFSASTLDVSGAYGTLTGMIENVARVFDADIADTLRDGIKAFEGAIGIDLANDLFGTFGDVMVSYNSPSDAFQLLIPTVAIKLKDGKKLNDTLDKLVKAIPVLPGGEVNMKRTNYRGAEILQIKFSGQANVNVATLGIYKNWLIYASYPQPIKGFILRQEGELPAWKADESLTKVLAQFPKEFNSIQVSDPRPTMQTLLSFAPFLIDTVNSVGSGAAQFGMLQDFRPFDVELIPHPQEATRHLFPNVTIGIDDGKRIRAETRGSLNLPF